MSEAARFYIPDIVHPAAITAEEERAAIVLIVEVTSPLGFTLPTTDWPRWIRP